MIPRAPTPNPLPGWRRALPLLALAGLAGAAAPAAATAAQTVPAEQRVGVWVERPGVAPEGEPETELWLAPLIGGLEARPGVRVVASRVQVLDLLDPDPARRAREDLRERARQAGARFEARFGISQAGGRYSLEAELRELEGGRSRAHFVLLAEGTDGLLAALELAGERLARATLEWVAEDRALFESAAVHAQQEPPQGGYLDLELPEQGRIIADIRVIGNRRVDADAILAVIGSEVGQPLILSRVGDDVRRIYGLGFFRNVQVIGDTSPAGFVLTYELDENPIIRRVTLTGNDNVGSDDIQEKLTLTVGSTIDYPLLVENRQRVEVIYQAQGYYEVAVAYDVDELGDGSVSVNFDIIEGEKLRLRAIRFEGNREIGDSELMDHVDTKPWGWLSYVTRLWDNSGLYAEPLFYQDLDRIQRLYLDRGYIRVTIAEPDVEVTDKGLEVSVAIVEGPRYDTGSVDVLGDPSMDRAVLLDLVASVPGEVFSRSTLSQDVEELRSYYADRGFFDANVVPRTDVDPQNLTIAITFEVEKGQLFFIDRIDIHGNTRTHDEVVRREISISEDELYSARAVERSRARMARLGYFEEVSLRTRRVDQPHRIAIDIDVVERPTGSFTFGAGVGSVDGFVFNGSITQDNLFGSGRAVRAQLDLGSRNTNVFLSFVEPYAFGSETSLSGSISYVKREFSDFDEEIRGFRVSAAYPLDEGETYVGTSYSFSSRDVESRSGFFATSLLFRAEFQGKSSTSLVGLSIRRDTRDDIRFPKAGMVTGAAIEYAGVGGVNEFFRAETRVTYYIPMQRWLGFDSTFVVNSRAGWAFPINDLGDFDDQPTCLSLDCQAAVTGDPGGQTRPLNSIDKDLTLPLTERYFLGGLGAFQLRGFEQRSIGPRRSALNEFGLFSIPTDRVFTPVNYFPATGCAVVTGCNSIDATEDFVDDGLADVIGGNKMFLLNLELQFPISEEQGLAGLFFLDMGNAFDEEESINPADFRFGTGVGIQWFSPFGPILLILGFPLDREDHEDSSVFEFSLGGSSF